MEWSNINDIRCSGCRMLSGETNWLTSRSSRCFIGVNHSGMRAWPCTEWPLPQQGPFRSKEESDLKLGVIWGIPCTEHRRGLKSDVNLGDLEIQEWKSECGPDSPLVILHTLFHLAKAKDTSWEMTKEEFCQYNIGPSLGEKEKHQLWNLLHKYLVVFAFTPGELGDSKITENAFEMGIPLWSKFH